MKRKVVDANYFQDPDLAAYLRASRSNFAVLIDYAGMEAYKGDAIHNIYRSLEILSKYAEQVLVLKGTRKILRQKLASAGLQRRMIDDVQTRGFGRFCIEVRRAHAGSSPHREQILELGKESTEHFARILNDAIDLPIIIQGLTRAFTPEELRVLRTQRTLQSTVLEKFVRQTLAIAVQLFRDHPDLGYLPPASLARNSLAFRVALSGNVLALRWIADAVTTARAEKLRNDMVDAFYVAYATFFDGLLTKDKKMQQIYDDTRLYLDVLFADAEVRTEATRSAVLKPTE